MAKLTGPLHSLEAHGSLGDTITVLKQFGRSIAKKKSKPTGPPSALQIARRAHYRAGANAWKTLTAPQQAAYRPAAASRSITPFNAYMSAVMATFTGAAGSTWDGGTTTWDTGSTTWD